MPGVLQSGLHALKFAFPKADLAHESYEGINARCRYYVHVTISRSSYAAGNIPKDAHFCVRNVEAPPAAAAAAAGRPAELAPLAGVFCMKKRGMSTSEG